MSLKLLLSPDAAVGSKELMVWVFLAAVGVVWLYQSSRWKNLFTALWMTTGAEENNKTCKGGLIERGQEPHVTVQICVYNEAEVIALTIAHACSIEWPKDKLHIQVLDDSTDQTCIDAVNSAVASWREKGVDVERLSRPDRVGYKAGNLRYSFDKIIGDYVAYFDADHRAEPDFLKNIIPYFFDDSGAPKEKVGLVQAPWGYYNTHQNILTECDAMGLDIHHMTEQLGRATQYKVFGFNGTGGVWRKQAVHDAGGFTWETVTEDIHLAYQCHLKGYEFIYARHFPQLLEVPSSMLAHLQQKNRWTKGFIQVFRMHYWSICRSPDTTLTVKYELLIHLMAVFQLLAKVSLLIMYPYVVQSLSGAPRWFYLGAAVLNTSVSLLEAVFASCAKVPGSNGHYSKLSSRLRRLMLIPSYFGLRYGLGVFELKAFLEGLFSNDSTFHTTPKEGAASSPSMKAKLAGKVNRSLLDDLTACIGIVVVVHQIFAYVHLTPEQRDVDWLLHKIMCFWNVIMSTGMLSVSVAFLWEKYCSFVSCRFRQTVPDRPVELSEKIV